MSRATDRIRQKGIDAMLTVGHPHPVVEPGKMLSERKITIPDSEIFTRTFGKEDPSF